MTLNSAPAPSNETARLAALYQVSQALGSSLNLDETLRIVMDSAIRLTRAERGFLMLFDDTGALVFRVARNAQSESLDERQFQVSRTVVHEVAQTGTPVVTTNAASDPRFSAHDSVVQFMLRSILAVPLKVRGQITGVLYVDNKMRDAVFGEDDLDLLSAFAGQAAMAIENARLYTQTDQALAARVAELQMMQTIDRELNAALDFEPVMKVTLDWALRQAEAERGWIGLVETPDESSPPQVRVVAGRGVETGQVLPADDPQLHAALSSTETQAIAPKAGPAAVVAPVVREGQVIAVIVVEREGHAFPASSVEFLARLADHAAIAIENARLYAAVKRANDAKSEFVRTVTHELKIPMTSIKGYSDLLKMVGPLTAQQAQFVDTIRSNVERMAVLVSDLSDISRIESGRLLVEIREVDLREVLHDTVSHLRGQLEAKEQSVSVDLPDDLPRVRADTTRLMQILTNLVSNAHKYSPPGGAIAITAHDEGECVRISVTDTGYGISPDDLARLFTQFFRAEDPNIREQPGWGLGLTITKRLVELLDGQIEVQSEMGRGSTFSVTLPAA